MNAQDNNMSSRKQALEKIRSFYLPKNSSQEQQGFLSFVSPPILEATKHLVSDRASLGTAAFNPDYKIAANSLLVPTELLWAAGFIPFNWEVVYGAIIAPHPQALEIVNKGSGPVPRCSVLNCLKGAYLEGVLPIPNIAVSSSAFCEGISCTMKEISNDFKIPHFHIDIPAYCNNFSIDSLADSIEKIFTDLCEVNDMSIEEGKKKLRKSFYYSVKAKQECQEIERLRKKYSPLPLGLEAVYWNLLQASFLGNKTGYVICKKLKNQIKKFAEKKSKIKKEIQGVPLAIYGLIPFGKSDVWRLLKEANVNIVFESGNYFGEIELPEIESIKKMSMRGIYKNIAQNLVNANTRGIDCVDKSNFFMKRAIENGAKGLVIFSHEHCPMTASRLKHYEDSAIKNGMKVVTLGGDCILGMPEGPTSLRLKAFLDDLKAFEIESRDKEEAGSQQKISSVPDLRVGIDFGSGFSKFVAIDKKGKVVKTGLFSSGIDYSSLLDKIRSQFNDYKDIKISLSGIGGENQQFKNITQNQITEVSSLILAVKALFDNLSSFIVIDIGSQDIKTLKFYNKTDSPAINTNKSCGAGTGMVLSQTLDRWKQSNPEITFSDIDQMAYEAKGRELINTTCGIFAITNVVSALIQSNEQQRKDILNGIYYYIADQAIKLLPLEKNTDVPLLLAGGIGSHKTLQKIFKERGFDLLELPVDITSQHLVAYGAALSLGNK